MKKTSFAIATLLIGGLSSMAYADDVKKESDDAREQPRATPNRVVHAKKKTVAKGEKPKASPGWVILEEEWSNPFLNDFSTALHNARERYRAREDKSASAEIDKAISWLQYAESHATKSTAEDLATAQADLQDFSASLKNGKPVLAKKLDAAFAHASVALARHHHFQSGKSMAEGDLRTAGRYLMAASDLLRNAAQSANIEYGSEAVDISDEYTPYGYWNDTIVVQKSKLEANLITVQRELEKLAAKLKASR